MFSEGLDGLTSKPFQEELAETSGVEISSAKVSRLGGGLFFQVHFLRLKSWTFSTEFEAGQEFLKETYTVSDGSLEEEFLRDHKDIYTAYGLTALWSPGMTRQNRNWSPMIAAQLKAQRSQLLPQLQTSFSIQFGLSWNEGLSP